MIYTVTLNPSIDHYMTADDVIPYSVNRALSSRTVCGGKGINVSLALNALGVENTALGFCGGFTGQYLLSELRQMNVKHRFFEISGDTRINTKILSKDGVTELNTPGPAADAAAVKRLADTVRSFEKNDTVVLSGSVPPCFDLKALLDEIAFTGARLIVDMAGQALELSLGYGPYLIKPNRQELYHLAGGNSDDITECVRITEGHGIGHVLVSDGERGAYLFSSGKCRFVPVMDAGMKAVNATGAGDSMIAGFIYGELRGIDPLVCAVCAGSATAYSEGIFDKKTFDAVIASYNDE